MRGTPLLLIATLACGGPPALPPNGAECGSVYGAAVYSFAGPCSLVGVQQYSALYLDGWATVSLQGWEINLVPIGFSANADETYWDYQRIDLEAEVSLPHEMEHVRLGPSSAKHCGWISDGFAAWSRQATQDATNDAAYVMRTCPGSP